MGESKSTTAMRAEIKASIRAYAKRMGLTEAEAGVALLRVGISRVKALLRYARSTKSKAARRRYNGTANAKAARRRRAGTKGAG